MIEVKEIEIEKIIKEKQNVYILTMNEDELKTLGLLTGNVMGKHRRRTEHTDKWWEIINKILPEESFIIVNSHIEFED